MTVIIVAPVLSETVGSNSFGPEETVGTAKFQITDYRLQFCQLNRFVYFC